MRRNSESVQLAPDDPVTQNQFDVFRYMSWFRVIFGIAGAVLVTLVIVNVTLREHAVKSCKRNVLDNVAAAHVFEHDKSAYAQAAVVSLLERSGSADPEHGAYPSADQQQRFCDKSYPLTFPNSIWGGR